MICYFKDLYCIPGVNTVDKDNLFLPQITSYDYDAPITESGDLTDKYYRIKSVISEVSDYKKNYFVKFKIGKYTI